jgi:hypothetical protein
LGKKVSSLLLGYVEIGERAGSTARLDDWQKHGVNGQMEKKLNNGELEEMEVVGELADLVGVKWMLRIS